MLTAAACSSSAKAGSSDATANTITIKDFKFTVPASLKVGATVTVKNDDSTAHTVTANDQSFNTGPIQPGTTKTFTVSKTGAIGFHCGIHNYMTGSLNVSS